ncbi:MAG TPA: stage II sporulation protein R, partial [Candidatus Avoscillospira stercoripullorum]|nr:stage II sporulation protein R [Candidatus Avoscillospira stercoripullorum]
MDGIFMVLTRTKRILLAAALILAATTTAVAALQREQMALSEKLIRLHVVANSDSEEDQAIKLQVRDAVLAVTQPLLEDAEEPKAALLAALPEIEQAAE